jgi:putative transposase
MTLFLDQWRIESIRLKDWDYASPGMYFVTICTRDKNPYFGKIVDGKMILSEIGLIAENYWREIPEHFPYTVLDEFIIMPDHIHGIIEITESIVETLHCNVSTEPTNTMSKISPKPESLPTIIRSYKSICTKTINKKQNDNNFQWQSRYYDRVIRDPDELGRVREYIINNPINWG